MSNRIRLHCRCLCQWLAIVTIAIAASIGAAWWLDQEKRPLRHTWQMPHDTHTRLEAGVLAPDLMLPALSDSQPLHLASYRDKKPVVLLFGSFT